jgi:Matrixin
VCGLLMFRRVWSRRRALRALTVFFLFTFGVFSSTALSPLQAQSSSTQPAVSPDTTLEVPFNGTYWQSMPNLTWASCDVSKNTRRAIDLAVAQWAYANASQGIPIKFTEMPCTNGNTKAQISIFEASATDLPGTPDRDVFGLTEAVDARNRICGLDAPSPCVAVNANIYLFTDNWEVNQLTYAQAAKTVAHELGHAVGLGHAHFCNFDSIMAQSCEPIFTGLGQDDVQAIDTLVDVVRGYFSLPAIHAQPSAPANTQSSSVTYHAGYNLVAGPRGTAFAGASGPVFTYLPGDSDYRSIPSSQPSYDSYGYWAYFPRDTTVQLSGDGAPFYSAIASPGQWFLIGNESGSSPMRVVAGATTVYIYDPVSGQYKTSDTIPVGQGAWVSAGRDGFIAVASTALTKTQVNCYLNLGSPGSC